MDILDEQRRKEDLHWTLVFSNVIAQWAQWLGWHSLEISMDFVILIVFVLVLLVWFCALV